MQKPIIELASITLKANASEADLLSASTEFQKQFLDHQPGFLRRELARLNERSYLDIVHWRSQEDAEAVMAQIEGSAACEAYFAVMDFDANDPGAGISHYASLATYGRP